MLFAASLAAFAVASAFIPGVSAAGNESSVSTAWYPGWKDGKKHFLTDSTWSKYTHVTYAFACVSPEIVSLLC